MFILPIPSSPTPRKCLVLGTIQVFLKNPKQSLHRLFITCHRVRYQKKLMKRNRKMKILGLNFLIKITLRRGCSPVNLLHIFRTPSYRNASEELLLEKPSGSTESSGAVQISDRYDIKYIPGVEVLSLT